MKKLNEPDGKYVISVITHGGNFVKPQSTDQIVDSTKKNTIMIGCQQDQEGLSRRPPTK